MTSATAGLRPRRARTTTYSRIASPVVVPVLTGPYGTPILDNFESGASQNLTARAGWNAAQWINTDTTMATDAIPHNAVGGPTQSNFWGTIAGPLAVPDSEGWAQLAAFAPTIDTVYVGTRITGSGVNWTGYTIQVGPALWRLVRWINGAGVTLGSDITTLVVVEGDCAACVAIGNTIQSWHRPNGGAWTLKHNVTNTAITANGTYLGLIARAGAGRTVSFSSAGGGDLSAHHNIVPAYRRVWAGRS